MSRLSLFIYSLSRNDIFVSIKEIFFGCLILQLDIISPKQNLCFRLPDPSYFRGVQKSRPLIFFTIFGEKIKFRNLNQTWEVTYCLIRQSETNTADSR